MQDTKTVLLLTGKIFSPGSYLSLSLPMKYQNLRRTDIIFSLLNPIEKAGPLETLLFRVSSQRNWFPLPSILLLL